MSLIHIGGGNYINETRLVSAVLPDSAPIRRLVQDARDRNMLIDATYGKRCKSVIVMDSGHTVLSFKSPEAIFDKEKSIKRGRLIVISGPSGCGKGTVINKLREIMPFWLSVSDTTRSIRGGETAGVDYNYLSQAEFEDKIRSGDMLEYASYAGRSGMTTFYGTPKTPVSKHLENGENVILEIEVQGAKQIKEKLPEAILIFIEPPSMEELKARLTGRGTETPADIEKRMKTAETEMAEAGRFDFRCVNEDVAKCAQSIKEIIVSYAPC
jgi:guanylate kinase